LGVLTDWAFEAWKSRVKGEKSLICEINNRSVEEISTVPGFFNQQYVGGQSTAREILGHIKRVNPKTPPRFTKTTITK
jgi:hypothetical protein